MKSLIRSISEALLALPFLTTAAETDGAAFFESRIRPVLVMHCYECHSAEKTKGGLRLDYRGGFEKGGESGALVNMTAPDKSLLLQAIRQDSKDLKMPKGADKLPDGVIADLTRWVSMGLPGLSENPPSSKDAANEEWQAKLAKRRSHWAWQPVHKPTVPKLLCTRWTAFSWSRCRRKAWNPRLRQRLPHCCAG